MKKLILVSGPPGIGKSTLAQALAIELNCFLLDKDIIDEPFSPNDRGEIYSKEIEPKVLNGMLGLAAKNLELGQSCILDAPWSHILFYHPEIKSELLEFESRYAAKLFVLELHISPEELKKRIKSRGLRRDQVKLTDKGWDYFLKTDRVGEPIALPHRLIPADLSKEKMLRDALNYIQS